MRVLYLKFCEYACQQANGRRSLIGVFDDIRTNLVPFDHPPFFVCVELEFEPTEGDRPMDLKAILLDEDGKEIFAIQAQGQTPRAPHGEMARVNFAFPIPGVRFQEAGLYRLDLLFNGSKVGEERLPVRVLPSGQPTAEGA